MPSSRQILRGLRRIGYVIDTGRGKGSHVLAYFEHQGKKVCVTTVQKANDIPEGTLASIRRAIGLTDREEFDKLVRGKLTHEEYAAILVRQGMIEPQ
jgi:predicted RNA binding protein YcfA (HicA-like mRNA interferase family)